jgi:hypothetical protein
MKKIFFITIVFGFACSINAYTQTPKDKAEQLASEFNKEKNKQKEKNGQVTEKHVTVEAKPDYRENTGTYAATYEMEGPDQFITLTQNAAGEWQADFTEKKDGAIVSVGKLKDVKIREALLTGTFVFANGKTQSFEAVFINRFVNSEPSSKGLAFKQVLSLSNGMIVDKAFYKRRE